MDFAVLISIAVPAALFALFYHRQVRALGTVPKMRAEMDAYQRALADAGWTVDKASIWTGQIRAHRDMAGWRVQYTWRMAGEAYGTVLPEVEQVVVRYEQVHALTPSFEPGAPIAGLELGALADIPHRFEARELVLDRLQKWDVAALDAAANAAITVLQRLAADGAISPRT
jgi:hypothetical protein